MALNFLHSALPTVADLRGGHNAATHLVAAQGTLNSSRRSTYDAKAIQVTNVVIPQSSPIVRLWMLRVLVPLGAHRSFIRRHGFDDADVATLLGMGRMTEAKPPVPTFLGSFSDVTDADEATDDSDTFDARRAQNAMHPAPSRRGDGKDAFVWRLNCATTWRASRLWLAWCSRQRVLEFAVYSHRPLA